MGLIFPSVGLSGRWSNRAHPMSIDPNKRLYNAMQGIDTLLLLAPTLTRKIPFYPFLFPSPSSHQDLNHATIITSMLRNGPTLSPPILF